MDVAELMAMMTPHGPKPGHVPGGIPSLTALDVAGAMGMGHLKPEWAALVLVKYCGDSSPVHGLWSIWFRRLMRHKACQGWETIPGQVERLSISTLDEAIGSHACRRCGGTGAGIIDGSLKACPACDGLGRQYPGERQMAGALLVSRHAYRTQWAGRVDWCRRELQGWERQALGAISRALAK